MYLELLFEDLLILIVLNDLVGEMKESCCPDGYTVAERSSLIVWREIF